MRFSAAVCLYGSISLDDVRCQPCHRSIHLSGTAGLGVLFLRFAILLGLAGSLTAQLDFRAQHDALTRFYTAAGGPSWVVNSGWGEPYSGAAHCSWAGVYCCRGSSCPYHTSFDFPGCTQQCAVWGLSLANNNLVGRIDDDSIWEYLDTLLILNLQGIDNLATLPSLTASSSV